ncbi:radical SAM/SPASM domain-containing protein [Campylobacter devanensis]|uniref:radical SAM/SPASM domain-containing protein n=1 Tax=Campylobacter devanensis TaxID=3161138 RepID=UPI000A343512|nr:MULTISPECIES: radical SAM protein [unclassified Campylobacter]
MDIYLLLTEKCNLSCSMCIRGKQDGTNLDLNFITNEIVLKNFLGHRVVITGGEPTMHPKFPEIVNKISNYAKSVIITTNGTSHNYFSKIITKDNLHFQVSIDGDENYHNLIRGQNTFKKTLSTVKFFDNAKAKYSIASVVNKNNIDSMENLEQELRKLNNLKFWRLSYEMPFGSSNFKNMMTVKEWNSFVDKVLCFSTIKTKIQKIFPFELVKQHAEAIKNSKIKIGQVNNCGSGKDKIYIYPDLNVYPCTCLTDFPIGNLKEESLEKILDGKKNKEFSNYTPKNNVCLKCEYLKFCNGGCIGMSYHYFGELGMGDIRCPFIQETISKNA